MENFRLKTLAVAISAASLASCGGGGGGGIVSIGGDPSQGIGGSGAVSSGTIDGFGSIFVNGVRFETDQSDILVDGTAGQEADLGLGMVVTVAGSINDDGVTGRAERVVADDELRGPIEAIAQDPDNDAKQLTVLGVDVIVERTGTVFDDVTFDSLAVGQVIEVSGFREAGNNLRATRVERETDFQPGVTEIKVSGRISDLSNTRFRLGDIVIDFGNADLSDVGPAGLGNGQQVQAFGMLDGGVLVASRVRERAGPQSSLDDGDDLSVQGPIRAFVSASQFEVNGVPVNAGNARLSPANLALAQGVIVEVEGTWNGSQLVANSVEARRGRIEVEARVQSVDGDRITLGLFNGSVQVLVDSRTLLDDDTGQRDNLRIEDIRTGDFLEVEARDGGNGLVATRIDRDDEDDDVLQAPVESFTQGMSITLLGVTFDTAGADFEDRDDDDLDAAAFFAQLQVGDLVKVKDDEPADGIADEVEFEEKDVLDGGPVFDDDDSDDDDDDDDDDSDDDDSDDDDSDDDDSDDDDSDDDDSDDDDSDDDD